MSRTDRPNVLFITDDQHRHDYLACAGAGFLNTPNLDRLAERGVRFTSCITNAPVCGPARVGLATGIRPHRLGALSNGAYVSPGVQTFYERFRNRDYRVGCAGKLHLTRDKDHPGRFGDRPCIYALGFTDPLECEGKEYARAMPEPFGPYTYFLQERGLFQTFLDKGGAALPAEAFEDVYIARRAAEWLDSVPDDTPWFYAVGFVGPHNPFDPPEPYASRYQDAEVPDPIVDALDGKPEWVRKKAAAYDTSPEVVRESQRGYCGAIEVIDDGIGALLDVLEGRGMLDNTFVVFTSDHGEMMGDHGLYTKSVAYESALRVPLIIAGPGIGGGRVSDALVELIDANPTVCELTGDTTQDGIDARSLAPILRGGEDEHRSVTFSSLTGFMCVRTRQHKLILNHNDRTELYDLEADPDERRNIADGHPDLVGDLMSLPARRF